jgi:CBS domain-containing protein
MKVSDVMTTSPVLSVTEDDELALASQMMLWAGVRHLPVTRRGQVHGVISEGDILRLEAKAGEREGARRVVGDAMSAPAEVIGPDAELADATERMLERRIDCLPVVEGERLVGIVTTTDILALQSRRRRGSLQAGPVVAADIMTRVPVSARPEDDLTFAITSMARHGVRHLPVVSDGWRVVGMLSDRDVRDAVGDPSRVREQLHRGVHLSPMKVAEVMTAPAIVAPQGEPLLSLAATLLERRVGALPIVAEHGRLVGIVSYVDVLVALYYQGEETALEPLMP